MASTSETGHAINVANFEDLISFCQGLGASYNPSKAGLKVGLLQTQLASVKANMDAVRTGSVAFNTAVGARAAAFDELKKLAPRLVNALNVTDASKELVKQAIAVRNKIQGRRAGEKPAAKTARTAPPVLVTPVQEPATEPAPKVISASQVSFDSVVEHFGKLVAILSTEPTYLPNEAELQVVNLNTRLTDLKNLNTAVINAYTTVSNARVARNQSLYDASLGLCNTAKQVKDYVKSIYGAGSAQYKQVNGIPFKTHR